MKDKLFDTVTNISTHTEADASRLILQNVRHAYLLVDNSLQVVYYNQEAQDGIRLFLGAEIYCGLYILDLLPEDKRPFMRDLYSRVLQGEEHYSENEFVLEKGGAVWYENTFLPARNANGEIVGVIVSSRDISEIKKGQKAIQVSEERLQFALEAANQGAWDWNLQTNEVVYSGSYKKLYGFADNELKNDVSEWITRIHPEDQQKMQDMVQEHLQSGQVDYDSQYRIRANNGEYRWVQARGRLVAFDGQGRPIRMIGTHTDITEAVRRETALKRMNERFDCMMKATNELMWEWDLATNEILRSKDGIRNVYGLSANESIRTLERWLRWVHPEDRPQVEATLAEAQKAPHQYKFEMEYRFRKGNGDYADIYDRGIVIRDEQGKAIRVIGSAQDISERKRLEKELLKSSLDHQRLIHQATVDTQEKERAEIGKELHDNVNQVLTTTKLFLDLALTAEDLRKDLVKKSLVNINNIIHEIRLLSRSLMDPTIDDLGLVDSIRDLVENIRLTQKLAVEFTACKSIEPLLDNAEKLALFRIIQESLNNVLRHANATTVSLHLTVENHRVCLTVQDDGVGFQPERLKKGAGLKNIQNRIYLINGTLQLDSKPQQGCRIHVQFPIKITS